MKTTGQLSENKNGPLDSFVLPFPKHIKWTRCANVFFSHLKENVSTLTQVGICIISQHSKCASCETEEGKLRHGGQMQPV